ncbi:aminodeoxychorismate lyase [Shewanella baltica OS223]|nr:MULTISPECIES: aminodeoxychorismate lyase [Shewanella]ACK46395.1 aminodeoxychorismate lyase [Shewanella baltica OS223]MDT3294856.1 aminodeoxychorismate lyase [Shewanella sp. SP2S2-6]HCE50863.1 aminodeoxychorismate lyase [Shewanella baltica]
MFWVNGASQASVDPSDRGLAYGDGLFATMRTGAEGILFFNAHQARLTAGAARLGFQWQMSEALQQQLHALAIEYPHHCIKLIVSRGVGGRGYTPPETVNPTEIVSVHAIPSHYAKWQQAGICLKTSSIRLGLQPLLAGMKHLNRLEQVLIKSHPLPQGFDDWLVNDIEGNVIESSMANVFFIKGNRVITPSLAQCGVAGVMREQVMIALLEQNMNIECLPVGAERLIEFDSAFITNSVLGIVDVLAIDSLKFSRAPITAQLRQTLSLTL